MAGFARSGDREGTPQLFAVVGVVRYYVTAYAVFAARATNKDLAVNDQRHQGHVLTLLVVLDLLVPCHLSGLGIERHQMIVGRGEVELVLPEADAAAGWVQLCEVFRQLPLVTPDLVAGLRIEGNDLVHRRRHEHDAVVDDRRGLVAFIDAGRKRPRRLQILGVGGVDLVERAVALPVIGPAVEHPVAGFRIGEALDSNRAVITDFAGSRYRGP